MAAPIEEQMYKQLIEREEERCRRIEEEYDKNEETRGKKEKRKKIAKPWTRPGPNALCQDVDLLSLVTEYDYDLSSKDFQNYCRARGILHVAGEPGSLRWDFFLNHNRPKNDYLEKAYFRFAEEVGDKRYEYTDEEMESGWRVVLLGRAAFQDCWEMYSKQTTGA